MKTVVNPTPGTKPFVLHVNPRVVAGPNRGGEDLYLDFYAELPRGNFKEWPPSTDCEKLVRIAAHELAHLLKVVEVNFGDEETGDGHGEYEVARYVTSYGFEWCGTGADALNLVMPISLGRKSILNPNNWEFAGKLNEELKVIFKFEYFVDGDAD